MSGRFHDGYHEARAKVEAGTLSDHLALLDDLFGRDALRYGATDEEVKQEALRQLEREWTDPAWERDNVWVGAVAASRRR